MHPDIARRLKWMAGADFRNPIGYVNGTWLEQPTPPEVEAVLRDMAW